MNHKLQGFALKTGGFLQLIFATAFVLDRYIIALRVVNGRLNIGIKPCIPGRKSRSKAIKYDKRRYKKRNRIEIMFGRLKDWRRVATRYDRCSEVFMSAIALAATVLFWL